MSSLVYSDKSRSHYSTTNCNSYFKGISNNGLTAAPSLTLNSDTHKEIAPTYY